jgi:hypothetical protein
MTAGRRWKATDISAARPWGVNIHSGLAVTPGGLVLGVPGQTGFNRAGRKNTALTRERQKNRPIEEKEGSRRRGHISDALKILHVCDRAGDNYELFDKAIQSGRHFLIRIVHNQGIGVYFCRGRRACYTNPS